MHLKSLLMLLQERHTTSSGDDTGVQDLFTWYLYETPPPTEPTDLVAQGGMGYAYLTWNGVEPLTGAQSSNFDFNQNEVQSQEQEYYNEKKANIGTPAPTNTTASFSNWKLLIQFLQEMIMH